MTRFAWIAIGMLALAGCTESSIKLGEDDGGSGRDGSVDAGAFDAGGGGERCGTNICEVGDVCCNPSCGICTAPGGSCPTIDCGPLTCDGVECAADATACCPGCRAGESVCSGPGGECPPLACPPPTCGDEFCPGEACCSDCDGNQFCAEDGLMCPEFDCPPPMCDDGVECDGRCCADCEGNTFCAFGGVACPLLDCPDECSAQDARGDGPCAAFFGYAWNGAECVGLSGCDCVGSECDEAFDTFEACQAAYRGCTGAPTCGGDFECPIGTDCDPCGTSSCPFCDDCVSACVPHDCDVGDLVCRASRPDCGPGAVSAIRDGCWECVNPRTCEPATDCRETGCDGGESCEECAGGWTCLGPTELCLGP
ncbi:MAG: hypothetical protein AAGE52_17085 [Myxococcota bacterium]